MANSGINIRPANQTSLLKFRCAPIEQVRIGFIGVGARGVRAVERMINIEGTEVVAICDFIEAKALENGFHVIDGRYLIPRDPSFYWDSRLHPNDMGFGEYAAGLITEIEKYVK